MSELDARCVTEHTNTALDIPVAGDYHPAIHNLRTLKAGLLRQAAESTLDIPKVSWEI